MEAGEGIRGEKVQVTGSGLQASDVRGQACGRLWSRPEPPYRGCDGAGSTGAIYRRMACAGLASRPWLVVSRGGYLGLELGDLPLQRLVFRHLAQEEAQADAGLGL